MKLHKFILGAACTLLINSLFAQQQASKVSVHFAFNKYDINADDLALLKNFKNTHPSIESVIIDGYTDTTGPENYNYKLSVKRCNAVKQALGYDETKTEVVLRVTAHGEKNLLFTTNPENRVAIIAINDKKAAVTEAPQEPAPVVKDTVAAQPPAPAPDTTAIAPEPPKVDTVPISTGPKELGNNKDSLLKQLQRDKIGESVVLSEIHFEQGRHVFLKSSQPALDAMLNALKVMPTLELEIQGHMCCDDELTVDGFDLDTKEFKLSYNRAKAVYDFMVSNGVDSSRLTCKGFGTRKRLVNPELTDEDRNKNRRVEFVITKK